MSKFNLLQWSDRVIYRATVLAESLEHAVNLIKMGHFNYKEVFLTEVDSLPENDKWFAMHGDHWRVDI